MEIFINPLSTPKKMTEEDELIPFSRDLETIAEMTWQQFVDRANELRNKLHRMYDESAVERQEYYRDVCVGGYNFGKTVGWVVNYSPHLKALEGVASALEAIAQWPNAGSMAWEMRKFIKFSSAHGYNNVPDVVEFGELIKKIGSDDPTNKNKFQIDMDFFYGDSGWGVDGESTDVEILQAHSRNVTGVIKGLERHAHPEIIDGEILPTQEEIEAQEREQREQYWKDFLADAKSFHSHPSFFDILDREELINRPYHKILTYPVSFCEILDDSVWNPAGYTDVNEAVLAYCRDKPYMVEQRNNPNTWPSTVAIGTHFEDKFERRLKRTLEQKPWLIGFSVKWQDVLHRSFIGGNYEVSHAGEVRLAYKNPEYDPKEDSFFNHEYESRSLEPEEEKLFLESVADIQPLTSQRESISPPKDSNSTFSGWKEAFLFKLADGRNFDVFLIHEYGSIDWEGKLAIVTHGGPEPLFKYNNRQLKSGIK